MTLIPMEYKAKEGTTPEDGSIEIVCKLCGDKFWVPAEMAAAVMKDGPVCAGCGEAMEKANSAFKAKSGVDTTSDSLTDKAKQV